jgi:hypothetical protein
MDDFDPRPASEWPIPPMDKGSGDKGTAFTWAMGHLILQRIADGETVKAITADARMPAYCTVFRWMQVVPDFGEAVREVRDELARLRLAARETEAQRRGLAVLRARARGERVRWWTSGQRSTYAPLWADIVLEAVENGEVLSHVLGTEGMPTPRAWYRWLKTVPGLAERYADACVWRECHLRAAREAVIEAAIAGGYRTIGSAVRTIEGRIGRLQPKTYRREALAPRSIQDTPGA